MFWFSEKKGSGNKSTIVWEKYSFHWHIIAVAYLFILHSRPSSRLHHRESCQKYMKNDDDDGIPHSSQDTVQANPFYHNRTKTKIAKNFSYSCQGTSIYFTD